MEDIEYRYGGFWAAMFETVCKLGALIEDFCDKGNFCYWIEH